MSSEKVIKSHYFWEEQTCRNLVPQTLPVQCHYSAGTDVGRESLGTSGNRVFDVSHLGLMELPLAIVTLVTIRPDDNGIAFEQCLDVWACLRVNLLDMPRPPYWASEGKHSQNPPCPVTPPSRHHLYFIHLINGLHRCYHITL